ncbi:phage tail protein [bacterium 210820-DFI.6.52]|nr:phage tail protein [bacterium 210820-DFI.6.52]
MLFLCGEGKRPVAAIDPIPGSYCVTYKQGGADELTFEVPKSDPVYLKIREESVISDDSNRYLVKERDSHGETGEFFCQLDLDELKSRFYRAYRSEETLPDLFARHLPPEWRWETGGLVSEKRVVELEAGTDFDVLEKAREVHGVCYRWDVPKRLLQVIKPSEVAPSGEFLTDELNLLSVGFCGETGDFATRLYPYGKEDRESGQVLNIASVNEGLEYVEDHSYSGKVISACYRDKDCEDPQELKDRAIEMLKTLAVPQRSYECKIADGAQTFALHQVVTLLDREEGGRVDHQIVEYRDFPLCREKNTATLEGLGRRLETGIKEKIGALDRDLASGERRLNEFVVDADATYARISETYTKGETDVVIASQVTQAKDVLRTEVSETYVTGEEMQKRASEIEQRMEEITLSVSRTGGDNLVRASGARLGLEDWTVAGTVCCDDGADCRRNTSAGAAFLLGEGLENSSGRLAQTVKLVPGGQYAWYFRCKLEKGITTGASASFGGVTIDLSGEVEEWTEHTGAFVAQDQSGEIAFSVEEGRLWVADITLVEGLVCTAWQQAKNELIAGSVSVSERGVEVAQAGDPFSARIDNRQFLIHNTDTGEDVAYFNKDEGRISKLTAEDGLTVRRRGNQSGALRLMPVEGGVFWIVND